MPNLEKKQIGIWFEILKMYNLEYYGVVYVNYYGDK